MAFWVWGKFLVCALIIVISGAKLARYTDAIAEKTGLGRTWVGIVFLGIATSMPELVTGISCVTVVQNPDMALGNAFGSDLFNLLILAILDIVHRPGPLLTRVSPGHILLAVLSASLVALATASVFIGSQFSGLELGWVSIFSPVLVLFYLIWLRIDFRSEQRRQVEPTASSVLRYGDMSTRRAYLGYAIAVAFIIGAGIWLATIGEEISVLTGWGASFVGNLFLAIATSLPELVVCLAALRLGAVDLAIGDILGANMINMSINIFAVDLFYRLGSVFSLALTPQSYIFAGLLVITMTLVVIAGLFFRPRRKTFIGASWNAIALILLYLSGTYALFHIHRWWPSP